MSMGIRSVTHRPCPLAMEEAVRISVMTCDEEPEICISKTQELLSKAQLLMRDLEELLEWCSLTGPSNQGQCRMIQEECQASIEEDGESLIVEGFRFESAVSRGDLRRLSARDRCRRTLRRHMTDGCLSSFYKITGQQVQTTGRGNNSKRRANK